MSAMPTAILTMTTKAYAEVRRNLGRLIDLGELRLAMELLPGIDETRKLPGRNER